MAYADYVPWNATQYQAGYSFVWEYGRDLVKLLDPQPGERILDAGCGTGQLTAVIAASGADVVGVDSSPAMIDQARRNEPALRFDVHDLRDLPYRGEFDAIFSNAVLHWVLQAGDAAASLARAVKPGGRVVLEMGGHGNVRAILEASDRALRELGVQEPERYHPWFYPSIAEYSGILERCGLEVQFALLFDRPTLLEQGLSGWVEMFCAKLIEPLAAEQLPEYHRLLEQYVPGTLRSEAGWMADYRRLRVMARKV